MTIVSGTPASAVTGEASGPLLTAEGVTVRFGGITALDDVSIEAPHREIVGLVGPNGSGKSTLFAVLSGLLPPNSGSVQFQGVDVTKRSSQARARLGLCRTFQHPQLFHDLSVRDHLTIAYRMRFSRRRVWKDLIDGRAWRRPPAEETERIDRLLELLDIRELSDASVLSLPLGTCRLVEVGRALATSPSLVLLDEPSSGLDASESDRLGEVLSEVCRSEGVSFVLVEHDVEMVLSLCAAVSVLELGQVIAKGTSDEVRSNPVVRSAYLGDDPISLDDVAGKD